MDEFRPPTLKGPASLLDPEVAQLAADYGVPILLTTRAVGQTVVAKAEIGWHPWLELGHQFRYVEDLSGKKSRVFWGDGREMQVNIACRRSHSFAGEGESDLRWGMR